MAERQMTIDDYLNNNKVSVMETMTPNPEADVITPELVDYNALKKEELINIIKQKDDAITTSIRALDKAKEEHGIELANMTEFYKKKIQEMSHLVAYYERKFKIVADIINIETGGEK
jgi:hypothetical protein